MAQKKKWTKETIERSVIDYILTKSEKEGEPSFPDNATLRMCDHLPNTDAIKRETGMYLTALFKHLYETGKIPFKYKPKKSEWNAPIRPCAKGVDKEIRDATSEAMTRYFRSKLKHM